MKFSTKFRFITWNFSASPYNFHPKVPSSTVGMGEKQNTRKSIFHIVNRAVDLGTELVTRRWQFLLQQGQISDPSTICSRFQSPLLVVTFLFSFFVLNEEPTMISGCSRFVTLASEQPWENLSSIACKIRLRNGMSCISNWI